MTVTVTSNVSGVLLPTTGTDSVEAEPISRLS